MEWAERIRRLAIAIAYVGAVAAATWVAAAGADRSHPIDPTAAIPLFAYLHLGTRGWWVAGLLAAGTELALRLALGAAAPEALVATASTAAQAVLVARLIGRWGEGRHWQVSLRATLGFAVSTVAGTLLGALVGLGVGALAGGALATPASVVLGWLGDAVGIATGLPFLLAWRRFPTLGFSRTRALEATGLIAVWVTFVASVANSAGVHAEVLLLLVPAFVWTAARFDLAWATLGNLSLVLFAPELEVVGSASSGWAITQLGFLLLLVFASLCLAVLLGENQRALRNLERSEAKLQAVLTSIPEVVLRVTADGEVLERLGSSLLDSQDGALAPRRLDALLPPEAARRILEVVAQVMADGHAREASASYVVGRRPRSVEARVRRLEEAGDDTASAIVSIRDVSESRASEQREAEREKALALRHLTGGVAHDFNNLLTTVIGNLDLLGEDVRDPDRLAALDDVSRAVQRGRELTRRLLAYSERQPLQPRPASLRRLLPDIVARLRRVTGPRIELDLSAVDAGDALDVAVDAARLEEALLSVVDNARDATRGDAPVRIRVDRRRTQADGDEPAQSFVRVAVRDEGEGMAPDILERACDPFFTTRGLAHSGLGLSMVKGFARQSGGRLDIASSRGRGTEVSLLIPSHQPGRVSGVTPMDPSVVVLVADADADVRRLVARHVMRIGYAPVELASAHEVESTLARMGTCALAVLDQGLLDPQLEASLRRSGTRRLLMRAAAETADLDMDALEKPFAAGALSERLAELLPERPTTPLPNIEDSWPPPSGPERVLGD